MIERLQRRDERRSSQLSKVPSSESAPAELKPPEKRRLSTGARQSRDYNAMRDDRINMLMRAENNL